MKAAGEGNHQPFIDTSLAWSRITTTVDVSVDRCAQGLLEAEVVFTCDDGETPGTTYLRLGLNGVRESEYPPEKGVVLRLDNPDVVGVLAEALAALHVQMTSGNVKSLIPPPPARRRPKLMPAPGAVPATVTNAADAG